MLTIFSQRKPNPYAYTKDLTASLAQFGCIPIVITAHPIDFLAFSNPPSQVNQGQRPPDNLIALESASRRSIHINFVFSASPTVITRLLNGPGAKLTAELDAGSKLCCVSPIDHGDET